MLLEQFLLDPQVIFLNHGSFGACPRPVFDAYQAWQRKLEQQPVQFLGVEHDHYLRHTRQELGAYIHAPADDIKFVLNATHAVNIIARSLHLEPGDEVLATDHEYGACNYTWDFICRKTGAVYRTQHIILPVTSNEKIIDQFWQGVTPRTRVIFISHITSPTSLVMPVQSICQRARAAGITSIIDGAHAPGQLPLDLSSLQADFYIGNCHNWILSPKGAGFFIRPTRSPTPGRASDRQLGLPTQVNRAARICLHRSHTLDRHTRPVCCPFRPLPHLNSCGPIIGRMDMSAAITFSAVGLKGCVT